MPFVRCKDCGIGLPVSDEELQEIIGSNEPALCDMCADDSLKFECPECNWYGRTDEGRCCFCHADVCTELY